MSSPTTDERCGVVGTALTWRAPRGAHNRNMNRVQAFPETHQSGSLSGARLRALGSPGYVVDQSPEKREEDDDNAPAGLCPTT